MKDFIVAKGIRVTDIELLTNFHKEEARSYTYGIAIKPEDYDKALSPDVWPYRVGIRPFKQKRQQQPNSWQQQAGQSGGNVMMDQANNLRRNQPSGMNGPRNNQPSGMNGARSMEDGAHVNTADRFLAPGFESEVFN